MGCFCAVPEEFYCEVLLLNESKLTLTTQQQGIKVGAGRGRGAGPRLCLRAAGAAGGCVSAVGSSRRCPCSLAEGGRASGASSEAPQKGK